MLKYSFGKTEGNEDYPQKKPYINIEIEPAYISDEINNLSSKQIKLIVDELQEVKDDKRDECHFGYECIVVWCRRKIEWGKYTPGKIYCLIDYDYGEQTLEVQFEDIYKLMKDWKEYIEKWEQETGLEKKGL